LILQAADSTSQISAKHTALAFKNHYLPLKYWITAIHLVWLSKKAS